MYRSIKTAALAATLTILGAATLATRPAEAQNLYGGFDVGAGKYSYENIGFLNPSLIFEESTTGYGLHFGFRPNRSTFGFEVSFAQNSTDKKTVTGAPYTTASAALANTAYNLLVGAPVSGTREPLAVGNVPVLTTEIKSSTIGIDALGYFPVSGQFEAIGTAGLVSTTLETKYNLSVRENATATTFDATRDAAVTAKGDGIGFRVGIGGQFAIGDRFNVRGLVRYTKPGGDLKDVVASFTSFEVGVNLLF